MIVDHRLKLNFYYDKKRHLQPRGGWQYRLDHGDVTSVEDRESIP
jgi:hypothetical protein